uniref:(northern house mosquito) hypothetical protein n=1 Tax=Culex pipiens TaxID=7175 RepID=A0A8D8IJK9_CULPI
MRGFLLTSGATVLPTPFACCSARSPSCVLPPPPWAMLLLGARRRSSNPARWHTASPSRCDGCLPLAAPPKRRRHNVRQRFRPMFARPADPPLVTVSDGDAGRLPLAPCDAAPVERKLHIKGPFLGPFLRLLPRGFRSGRAR